MNEEKSEWGNEWMNDRVNDEMSEWRDEWMSDWVNDGNCELTNKWMMDCMKWEIDKETLPIGIVMPGKILPQ